MTTPDPDAIDDARRAAALILATHRDDQPGQREILAATAEVGRVVPLVLHLARLASWIAGPDLDAQLTAYLHELTVDEANQ
ncbi:hypothetical protein [Gordonia sp. WA4-43]|uniref:hypothetical protein n=1 Tax=Gordonia sp. WA4-43 TaxID=2878678 RepID=UPI001CF93D97|nr:hypothetical protein [Gordonia sp. WA4-43]UCZ89854.1 hypothetical protein LEL84_23100 [Gordonia sp. WA4-43]